MKLAVRSGKPSHVRSGESEPARAVADSGMGASSVSVDEVRVKLGRSMPSKGVGARGRVSMVMSAPFLSSLLLRIVAYEAGNVRSERRCATVLLDFPYRTDVLSMWQGERCPMLACVC